MILHDNFLFGEGMECMEKYSIIRTQLAPPRLPRLMNGGIAV